MPTKIPQHTRTNTVIFWNGIFNILLFCIVLYFLPLDRRWKNFKKSLLEIWMCSNTFFYVPFSLFLRNLICSYKRIVSSWKIRTFSYYIQVSWKIWCVQEISLKKVAPRKKEHKAFLEKIAYRLLHLFCLFFPLDRRWKITQQNNFKATS